MNALFQQIGVAAENGLYFLALAGALMIPDICGALESQDGTASGARYRAWFDQNVAAAQGGVMDGDTCYKFRCSLLHQGTTQHPKGQYTRILFVEPGPGPILHMNIMNDALNIDAREFCRDLVRAALLWRARVAGTEPYETNVRNFVTRYPNGLQPYIVGIPVIS